MIDKLLNLTYALLLLFLASSFLVGFATLAQEHPFTDISRYAVWLLAVPFVWAVARLFRKR